MKRICEIFNSKVFKTTGIGILGLAGAFGLVNGSDMLVAGDVAGGIRNVAEGAALLGVAAICTKLMVSPPGSA